MISVARSPQLQAAILALKRVDRDLRLDIYADARRQLGSAWTPALEARAKSPFDRRVIVKGARVKVGTDGFSMVAASSTKALSGGFVPADSWYADEFGARRRKGTFRTTSRRGRPYNVTKTINRQLPGRVKDGRIAFDAASEIGTRLVAVWVVGIVGRIRAAAEAIDG